MKLAHTHHCEPAVVNPSRKKRLRPTAAERELKQLLLHARRDPALANPFIARIEPLCRHWLRPYFRDGHDRADAVQIVLPHVLRSIDRYDGRRRVFPWLRTVVKRKSIEFAKSLTRRRGKLRLSPLPDEYPAAAVEPIHPDDRGAIEAALARLAPEDRRLIVERLIEERPLRECSEGKSISTTFRRIEILRERLRLALAGPFGIDLA